MYSPCIGCRVGMPLNQDGHHTKKSGQSDHECRKLHIPYFTIDQIKQANKDAGLYFFEKATLRFFSSRIGQEVFQGPGGIYFVTSEQRKGFGANDGPRLYTVRRFDPMTGEIGKASEFQAFATGRQAKVAAKRYAETGLDETPSASV